jgi:hypothetical protein
MLWNSELLSIIVPREVAKRISAFHRVIFMPLIVMKDPYISHQLYVGAVE